MAAVPHSSDDPLLYGHDPMDRIVAVQALTERSKDRAAVRIYRRSEDGLSVHLSEVPFYPFFFLSDVNMLSGFPRDRFRYQSLAGDLHFNNLIVFNSWNEYWNGLRHAERRAKDAGIPNATYTVPTPAQQYMMQSGRTLFKGLNFDEVHRLQLDIECVSSGDFPNADRPADRIILVAFSDNRGWRTLVGNPDMSEEDVLIQTIETIQRLDPDVIEGHNIFRFDFPYLMRRCAIHGIPFSIGRDRSEPRTFASSTRFAERALDFTALDIAGRHVVDTYFLSMAYDMIKRDLPGYGLKEVSRHFGFAPPDRTYVDGGDITRLWNDDPDRLMKYAADDAIETERLARHLSGSNFYLTQMLPMAYGQVSRVGPASKIESLFVREYLRQKHALPRSEWGSQSHGGYTDIFFAGIAGPVVYADVESLYPSVMLQFDIRPDRDELGVFPALLGKLTAMRLETKRDMNQADTGELKSALDARQSAYKIVINSFYGYLGFAAGLFNDYSEADRVATTGQSILLSIMNLIHERGGRLIEVDTDGVLFVPPDSVRSESEERAFIEDLNELMPKGIRIGFDGRYERILSYKKKNYALQDYSGHIKMKGSSLVSRSIEPFGRRFVRRSIQLLLQEDVEGLHAWYLQNRNTISEHGWEHAQDFSRTDTLKDSLKVYSRDVEAGKRPRSAVYELALRFNMTAENPFKKGDRIAWYVSGSTSGGPAFESAKLLSEWNASHPDENTSVYLKRLDELTMRFEPYFSPTDFRSVFSEEDLFGFDASSIQLKSTTWPIPDTVTESSTDDEEF